MIGNPTVKHKRTTWLFRNGRNQALRLSRDYEIRAKEVYIERDGAALILTPKPADWAAWFDQTRLLSEGVSEQVWDMPLGKRGVF